MSRFSPRDRQDKSSRPSKPQQMRNRIAAQAGRLMAEDGIADFALAKEKAARQLGAPSTQALPSNDEVEAELKAYRELYHPEQHTAVLQALRGKALAAMRFFEKFDPYLTGPVLSGTAGAFSAIHLSLFSANEKELSMFLLDRRLKFEIAEETHFRGPRAHNVPAMRVEWDGTPLHLALYEPVEIRGALRQGAGVPAERANIAAVERLIAADAA